jgi:hypothetical protein
MTITMREYLGETVASDTLKNAQKTKQPTTNAARALEMFMKLAPEEQEKHLDFLQKALSDEGNDVWKTAPDYAAQNRKGLKDNPSKNKKSLANIKAEITEAFPEFTEELQERFADLFTESVAKTTFAEAVGTLMTENPELRLLMASNEELDMVESLAERIQELEDAVAEVAQENAMMVEAQRQSEQQKLQEELLIDLTRTPKRQHNIADDFEPDPENSWLLAEDTPRRSNDPMSRYASYIEQTVRGRPIKAPVGTASYLTETWEKTQS